MKIKLAFPLLAFVSFCFSCSNINFDSHPITLQSYEGFTVPQFSYMSSTAEFDAVFQGHFPDAEFPLQYDSVFFSSHDLILTIITSCTSQKIVFHSVEKTDDILIVSYGFDRRNTDMGTKTHFHLLVLKQKMNAVSAQLAWDKKV